MSDLILFAHPTFGVLGILSAVWVFVEALNAREGNASRTRLAAFAVTAFICLAWALGGFWYVTYYAPEKAIILKGPWPWAHDFFMETKEHLFFIPRSSRSTCRSPPPASSTRARRRATWSSPSRRLSCCPAWPSRAPAPSSITASRSPLCTPA